MIETWHAKFSPRNFLCRVNIDLLIDHNKAYNENSVEQLANPCILCRGSEGPGLLLNDKTYLCKSCFSDVSTVGYPEKYEKLRRQYITDREARNQARTAFIKDCSYRRVSRCAATAALLFLLTLFFHVGFIVVSFVFFLIYLFSRAIRDNKLRKWDSTYPTPPEPTLKHFHDPAAELTRRDEAILKIFNNWPGYPPFWEYLREVVLKRDANRCQVSGCPSRIELHIHHKTPVSQGGEHVPANLVSLCSFHHALEPDEGHERIWGKIKTRYFTMVRAHRRRNSSSLGYHDVRAHVRRLELMGKTELLSIANYYGLSCSSCSSSNIGIDVNKQNQQVIVTCLQCRNCWVGKRQLSEETGPRLSEALHITRNKGVWTPRWDMLETRADSTFRLLKNCDSKLKSNRTTIKSKESSSPKCPKCGSMMRLIKPKKGDKWKMFWGCSRYGSTGCKGSADV